MTNAEQWRDAEELRRLVAELRSHGGEGEQARAVALEALLADLELAPEPEAPAAGALERLRQEPEHFAALRASAVAAFKADVATADADRLRSHLGLPSSASFEDAPTVTAEELEALLRQVRLGEEVDVGTLAAYADAAPSGEEFTVDLDIDTGSRPLPDGTLTLRADDVVFVARLRRHLSFDRVRGATSEWRFGVKVHETSGLGDVVPMPGLQRQLAPAASATARQAWARAVASDLGLVCSLRELPTKAVALTVTALDPRWEDQLVQVETLAQSTASSWVVPLTGAAPPTGTIVLPPRDIDEVRLGVEAAVDVDGERLQRSIRAADTAANWRRIAELRAGSDLAEEILRHL